MTSARRRQTVDRARAAARVAAVPAARARPRLARGLTLLEVILAIAILGGCLAVIGELARMGVRHAEEARELTMAQLLCEGKLEEVAAGATPAESASAVPFESEPDWTYTIEVGSLEEPGLIQVRVTVQPLVAERLHPNVFTLTRWMLDPSVASAPSASNSLSGSTTEGQATTPGGGNDASN